jgi:membrane fusion protein (multidrug efflux system)
MNPIARRPSGGGSVAAVVALLLAASACGEAQPAQRTSLPVVEVAPAMRRDTRLYREWAGTIDGYFTAEVQAQVEGHLLRQLYHEGSFVRKGDVLFEIDPRPFQAALDQDLGDLARDEAALARMWLDLSGPAPLTAERVLPQGEIDVAPTTLREAKASVDSARAVVEMARLNLAWTKVIAPVDGIAGVARAQVGQLVRVNMVLTSVSVVDPVKVLFYANRQDYLSWTKRRGPANRPPSAPPQREGQFELILSDGSLYRYRGDPMLSGRDADVRIGTIMMTAVFPNPDHLLRPGLYGRVRAAVDVSERVLLVPQRAVIEKQDLFQVAVVGPDSKVSIRNVQTGERVGMFRIIKEGLNPGDRVAVSGFQNLTPGMLVQPRPAEAEARPGLTGGGD